MGLRHRSATLDSVVGGKIQEQLSDALFERGHDFALLLGPEGHVIEASESALEIAGQQRSEVVTKRLWKTPWFRPANPESHQLKEDLQRVVGGETLRREFTIRGDGDRRVVDAVIEPITGRREVVEVVLLTGHDITDLRRRETALEAENECLEEFLRAVSHDVRNLLNVASGNLELATGEEQSSQLRTAMRSLEQAGNLIDDLSELVSEGRLVGERAEVRLAIIAKESWHHVETEEASLSIESSMELEADKTRLMELFENLYRNAVEHGGPAVSVRVGTFADGFYVADDGSGIPDLAGEDPFEVGVTTDENGTGLGLSIGRKIVSAHGWEIDVTESADGGARFEIRTDPPLGR